MLERELSEAVEVIPDRLYWVALHNVPKSTANYHYFTIDNRLVYEPFSADFGPLNLAMTFRYCKMMEAMLKDPMFADMRIVHYCSHEPDKRANSAFLITAYMVIAHRKTAETAFDPFTNVYPNFMPFRDATRGVCTFQLTILDCLKGLETSIKLGWFDWHKFEVESYEFHHEVENGDINWIIPDRFLAFTGPCATSKDADGFPAFTPEDYVPIFRSAGIVLVVRLNSKQYEKRRFIENGIKHVDLYFRDGSIPPADIISKFLHITENEPGAIAVHCKAGLGRTGTLMGLYAMKHYQFPARAFIGWNRICRPGSILGPQQQFMVDMQNEMFQAGAARRSPQSLQCHQERLLSQRMEKLSLRPHHAEAYEDEGQGDFLVNSKRKPPGREMHGGVGGLATGGVSCTSGACGGGAAGGACTAVGGILCSPVGAGLCGQGSCNSALGGPAGRTSEVAMGHAQRQPQLHNGHGGPGGPGRSGHRIPHDVQHEQVIRPPLTQSLGRSLRGVFSR
eukprot:TRINITY_DN68319_c0_g1_i1.p1 TRINITY_DN68319_c0_g1~~TRINITY_DN68319_c0_g1_i1.p1  ORF type:complete len:507 (-),score=57.75 TRINITY_DN68319_c0_g1_i1:136-1656(-)